MWTKAKEPNGWITWEIFTLIWRGNLVTYDTIIHKYQTQSVPQQIKTNSYCEH